MINSWNILIMKLISGIFLFSICTSVSAICIWHYDPDSTVKLTPNRECLNATITWNSCEKVYELSITSTCEEAYIYNSNSRTRLLYNWDFYEHNWWDKLWKLSTPIIWDWSIPQKNWTFTRKIVNNKNKNDIILIKWKITNQKTEQKKQINYIYKSPMLWFIIFWVLIIFWYLISLILKFILWLSKKFFQKTKS